MRLQDRVCALLVAAALGGFGGAAHADDHVTATDAHADSKGSTVASDRIASEYASFAGSRHNATNLVTGLRTGSTITLAERHKPSATFTPPTRPMGYGNVSISLALARYQLAQQGITHPTPRQLETALMGGTITSHGKTVAYSGVLQMRAQGMGWGQIAHASGTKLGPIVSSMRAHNTYVETGRNVKHYGRYDHGDITTASGGRTEWNAHAQEQERGDHGWASPRGVVTAGGGAPHIPQGHDKSHGPASTAAAPAPRGQGIVTAGGAPNTWQGHGRSTTHSASADATPAPRGQGIVTAAGGAPNTWQGRGNSTTHSASTGAAPAPHGQGIVTASGSGGSPYSYAASGSHGGTGIVTASGTSPTQPGANANGQARGHGHGGGHFK
jgi:hypothetical protein